MSMSRTWFCRIFMAALCCTYAGALQAQEAVSADADAGEREEIEEIIVHGPKSLITFRSEMEQAMEVFVGMYNDLNDNDEFDIVCIKQAPIGSRIIERTCLPQYRWEFLNAESTTWIADQFQLPAFAVQKNLELDEEDLEENVRSVLNEHPQLLEAIVDYDKKVKIYQEERKRRCKGRLLTCKAPE